MERSAESSSTRALITNSNKYGLTTGSYAADVIAPTDLGLKVIDPAVSATERLSARFSLAIDSVPPFKFLYGEYRGKKLPAHEVMKDVLRGSGIDIENEAECLDIFIVNVKYLGLLQTAGGSETLVPLDQIPVLGDPLVGAALGSTSAAASDSKALPPVMSKQKWAQTCFYIAPIGDEGTEQRKHSDLFLGSLIEPALKEFGLTVVRADAIGEAGMITSQVLEHIFRCRLAIVDLSFHNPNAFYEMAVRHACRLPVIQITRKHDRLPFDVNQVRTVVIDTSDIYSLVPRLETYRSEISNQVRAALADGATTHNPLSVFFPEFQPVLMKRATGSQ